jgi:hypothetical protein
MFIESAPIVLNAGQVFQKRRRPSRETIAEATARDRHHVGGTMKPRKPRSEARKPNTARIQKMLLTSLRVDSERLGNSHDRAGIQNPSECPTA